MTRRRRPRPWPAEVDVLEEYRCQQNLGVRELAVRMARAGFPVAKSSLDPLLRRERVPLVRTLYRIRRFLDCEWAAGRVRNTAPSLRFPLLPTPEASGSPLEAGR